jgi:purine-cytosine permease-like protein
MIGMAGGLLFGSADPTKTMLAAHLGLAALAIIGLSTVTTTFLDVFSAGISLINVFPRINERFAAVIFTALGTALALVFPMALYTNFLYLLGSVFSPLIAVLLTDYFFLKQDNRNKKIDGAATASLIGGFVFYYLVKALNPPIGATLTTMVFTTGVHFLIRKFLARRG